MLDTDTFSYLMRGSHPAIDRRIRFAPPESIVVSTVTYAELLAGLRSLPFQHPLHQATQHALALFDILPWSAQAAEAYADIAHSLTRNKVEIGELDMMIAAHALALNLTLISNNTRHFRHLVPPLKLENWAEL